MAGGEGGGVAGFCENFQKSSKAGMQVTINLIFMDRKHLLVKFSSGFTDNFSRIGVFDLKCKIIYKHICKYLLRLYF